MNLGILCRSRALAVAMALSTLPLAAQIYPTKQLVPLGPVGGSCPSVVVHPQNPDVLLVIKYTEGLFFSSDGGVSFAPFGQGLTTEVRGLRVDPRDNSLLAWSEPSSTRGTARTRFPSSTPRCRPAVRGGG